MNMDTIGDFPFAEPNCMGCGQPLTLENAWMTDGCPCNSGLGVNSMNETRWRLLMQLQQNQQRRIDALMRLTKAQDDLLACYRAGNPTPVYVLKTIAKARAELDTTKETTHA